MNPKNSYATGTLHITGHRR